MPDVGVSAAVVEFCARIAAALRKLFKDFAGPPMEVGIDDPHAGHSVLAMERKTLIIKIRVNVGSAKNPASRLRSSKFGFVHLNYDSRAKSGKRGVVQVIMIVRHHFERVDFLLNVAAAVKPSSYLRSRCSALH